MELKFLKFRFSVQARVDERSQRFKDFIRNTKDDVDDDDNDDDDDDNQQELFFRE